MPMIYFDIFTAILKKSGSSLYLFYATVIQTHRPNFIYIISLMHYLILFSCSFYTGSNLSLVNEILLLDSTTSSYTYQQLR